MEIERAALYAAIFKRKSFHRFGDFGTIAPEALAEIGEAFDSFRRLCPEIETDIRIVPAEQSDCRRGQQYCILLYSKKRTNYLQNIGYLGEQLDLYLVSRGIGTLWYGIGKPDVPSVDAGEFVIMMAIAQINDPAKFRKDMFRAKRKPVEAFWEGEPIAGVTDIVRFAPSACNSQPWLAERNGDTLQVFRYAQPGKRGIMPAAKVSYYNRIDMGIFLCFLDLCLEREEIGYERTLYDDCGSQAEKIPVARYTLRI